MVFESLLAYSRFVGEAVASRREESRSSLPVTLDGRQGEIYTEDTFRHFLGIERLRATRSGRDCLLLLVSLRRCPRKGVQLSISVSAVVLNGLGLCVREVDFIGWYRRERVAAAVLTQGFEGPGSDAKRRIVERITGMLRARLPQSVSDRLRVRVVRLGGPRS
jgi:hypothetical protein